MTEYIKTHRTRKTLSYTGPGDTYIKAETSFSDCSYLDKTFYWSLSEREMHSRAAMHLAKKLGLPGEYVCAKSDSGYIFILINPNNTYSTTTKKVKGWN